MEVAIALGCCIVFGALGDILFSKGMRSHEEVAIKRIADIPRVIRHVFQRPVIVAGIVSMSFYFFAYIAALAYVDVSVANPLTTLSYVLVTMYAALGLRERITWRRCVGICLVTLGAVLVGLSS